MQLRSPDKDSYPNHWDISCGGHVVAGEDSLTAALNELQEELGLDIDASDLRYLLTWKTTNGRPRPDFINNSFNDLYLLRTQRTLTELRPQPEEIAELKFFTPLELKTLVDNHDARLVPHSVAYRELFRILGVA